MYLHENPNEMAQLIAATAEFFSRAEAYIEKDYYAMMVLREAVSRNPRFVFKGGTCLSKCYHAIERFPKMSISVWQERNSGVNQGIFTIYANCRNSLNSMMVLHNYFPLFENNVSERADAFRLIALSILQQLFRNSPKKMCISATITKQL